MLLGPLKVVGRLGKRAEADVGGDEFRIGRQGLLESGPRFGGKITTKTVDDFIIEGGPDSFLTQKPWGLQLCRDLGLTDRLIPTNDHRRNIYVLNKGKLTPFPGGYRLTTTERLDARTRSTEAPFRFGFAYLPGVPTASPLSTEPIACTRHNYPSRLYHGLAVCSRARRRRVGHHAIRKFHRSRMPF